MMDNVELVVGGIIGRGGFADVHLGMYGGSQVAIKVHRLPVNLSLDQYSVYRDKCNQEATVLKSLQHENVLRFIDVIEQNSTRAMCLIVEYVDGGSMERFCKDDATKLSDRGKKRIACSCWRGLAYLHDKKVCHKDIKPDNILISIDLKNVKIADFGIAEFKNLTSIYSTNSLDGTIMYLPPELASQGTVKPYRRHPQNSDVYSMGATLCVFYSCQPFWTVEFSSKEVMFKLIKQWESVQNKTKPMDPNCWNRINDEIQNVLIHAINADYAKRKSANEMLVLFEDVRVVSPILLPFVNDTDIMEDGSWQERFLSY